MIEVKIPATSANLGAGFDSLGIALTMYNKIWIEESDSVDIASIDGSRQRTDKTNLIYTTVEFLYNHFGKKLPGLFIRQKNDIPFTRGLGSSSACIIGGLLGANHLLGNPLDKKGIIDIAAKMEGHPDNSTPALLGGFVASVYDGEEVHCIKKEIQKDIDFYAFIPSFPLSTEKARAAVPKTLSLGDAIHNLSRASLFSISIQTGAYHNLKVACQDKLHQPHRLPLIERGSDIMDISYALGAYASYISGAGSTIMSIVDDNDLGFANRAREKMAKEGIDKYNIVKLKVDNTGATLKETDKSFD